MEYKTAIVPIDRILGLGKLSDLGVEILCGEEYSKGLLYKRWEHYNPHTHVVVKIVDEKKWILTLLKL